MDMEKIRQLCTDRKIEWTLHAAKRLLQRGILSNEVESAIAHGDVIEDYPEDYPYPSCLVMGNTVKDRALHIVCAIDGDKLWIITAYEPNSIEWEDDFRTRKEKL